MAPTTAESSMSLLASYALIPFFVSTRIDPNDEVPDRVRGLGRCPDDHIDTELLPAEFLDQLVGSDGRPVQQGSQVFQTTYPLWYAINWSQNSAPWGYTGNGAASSPW